MLELTPFHLLWDLGPLRLIHGQGSELRHAWLVAEHSSKKWLPYGLLRVAVVCSERVPGAHGGGVGAAACTGPRALEQGWLPRQGAPAR